MKKQKKLWRVLNRMAVTLAGALILLAVMIASSTPQAGFALPGDLSSATSKYPNLASSALNTCDLCHTASIPTLNPFGAAYKANGRNPAAFGLIENIDSDGDGFTNIQEINALTFPGNPASKPAAPTAVPPTAIPPTAVPPTAIPSTPIPTAIGPTAIPTTIPTSAFVTIGLTPPSVNVGGSSAGAVSLNNVPAGGLASVEFACTFNSTIVEVSNIVVGSLFGADPVTVVNGPQNGSFLVAIAGSKGNKATTSGPAFTFSAKSLQVGQSAIDCQTRVSTGNLLLVTIPSTPATLVATSAQGTLAGKVVAGKPVTVQLNNPDSSAAGSVTANVDGTFSLSASAGTYTAIASAPGYLKAQASVNITNGSTTTLQTISLLAGDIDGNNVIDQFDALTVGINYNGTAPAAADLNNDGTINVLDLEVLAVNYRQTGPQAWQ
ncbi:MAG: carboxypeptidase regulatory-like domain-containing protein [Chloroflexota bacterium]